MKKPKVKYIKSYGDVDIYEIYMPDGNSFRYSNGHMIPFRSNIEQAVQNKENENASKNLG